MKDLQLDNIKDSYEVYMKRITDLFISMQPRDITDGLVGRDERFRSSDYFSEIRTYNSDLALKFLKQNIMTYTEYDLFGIAYSEYLKIPCETVHRESDETIYPHLCKIIGRSFMSPHPHPHRHFTFDEFVNEYRKGDKLFEKFKHYL